MQLDFLLIGAVITVINSLFLNSINRTIQRKEKLEQEKIDKIEEAFIDMSRKVEILLKRHDKIIEILSFIVYEHKKNHGDITYLTELIEKVRE